MADKSDKTSQGPVRRTKRRKLKIKKTKKTLIGVPPSGVVSPPPSSKQADATAEPDLARPAVPPKERLLPADAENTSRDFDLIIDDHVDTVRVGDVLMIRATAMEQVDVIKGVQVYAAIKVPEGEYGGAQIVEGDFDVDDRTYTPGLKDFSKESIDDDMRQTLHSNAFTNEEGNVYFCLKFIQPGEVELELAWLYTAKHKHGQKIRRFKVLPHERGTEVEYAPLARKPAFSSLEELYNTTCHIKADEEAPVSSRVRVTVFLQDGAGNPAKDVTVEIETPSNNLVIVSDEGPGPEPQAACSMTGEDGYCHFSLSHVGGFAEMIRYLVKWEDFKGNFVTQPHRIRFVQRDLECHVEAPMEAEAGTHARVGVQVTNFGRAVQGVAIRLKVENEKAEVFLASETNTRVSGDFAHTAGDGFILFDVLHKGDKPEPLRVIVEWDHDGEWKEIFRSIRFVEKKEEKKMEATAKKSRDFSFMRKPAFYLPASIFALLLGILIVIGVDAGRGGDFLERAGANLKSLVGVSSRPSASSDDESYALLSNDDPSVHEMASEDVPPVVVEEEEALLPEVTEKDDMVFALNEAMDSDGDSSNFYADDSDEGGDDSSPAAVSVDEDDVDILCKEDDCNILVVNKKLKTDLESAKANERKVEKLSEKNGDLEDEKQALEAELEELKKQLKKPQYVVPKKLYCPGDYEIRSNGIYLTHCKPMGKK